MSGPEDARQAPWLARLLTLYPEMFPGPLGISLAGRALEQGIWACEPVDIRSFATDRHGTVDDAPFGGGPGMVMRADVLSAAIAAAHDDPARPLIYLSPRGRVLDQDLVRQLAAGPGVTLICGRFEGVDERIFATRDIVEVSLGDFVLSGGEPAALALLDACIRLLPGVMGDVGSGAEESFERGLLEYPHYTRPAEWVGPDGQTRGVPEVLLSGHHARIEAWRRRQAEDVTRQRRPDLWARYVKATHAGSGDNGD